MKKTVSVDSLLIAFFVSVLIWPLFFLEYLDNWASIESTFIADARMLIQQLPHPGWQPLWYCGTRFDYIYPPALRYGTALISLAGNVSTARGYHLYIAALYVFGIVAVYWLVRAGSGSRWSALFSAAGTALLSPSFLVLTSYRHDSGFWVPQRLHALMGYGEGPHVVAVCVLPAALAASFFALRQGRWRYLALAGILCAFTVANNFYGATALALSFPVLAWAVWTGEQNRKIWPRAGLIVAFAYGLSAFWLTPSYVRITLINLQWVARPRNNWSVWVGATCIALFCMVTWRLARRRPDREWPVFVAGLLFFFGISVLGAFFLDFRPAGNGERLIPELDLAAVLAAAEVFRFLWRFPKWRTATLVLAALMLSPSIRYMNHAWSPFPEFGPPQRQYEFRMAKWASDHLPGERVLPTGSVRFWFDVWDNNSQPDGGSLQGMSNQNLPAAFWQIFTGHDASIAVLWLQALGTGAVIVPDRTSPEIYHDFTDPHKFRGAVPALYDDKKGTVIYRIPRIQPGIGRVIDTQALAAVGKVRGGDDVETLTKYVGEVEKPGQPAASVTWSDFDHLGLHATVTEGQSILLQETFDPYWRAEENGKALPVRIEPVMGFMLIDAPPGTHRIQMRFQTPLENRAGQVISGLSVLAMAALMLIPGPARASAIVARSIAPMLSVRKGKEAIEFYKNAFGASEMFRIENESGEVVARLSAGRAEFWVADESPANKNFSPESLGGGSVRMVMIVDDPDAAFDRAVRAGASVIWPVGEQHGWRLGRVVDPYGHHWEIGKELIRKS